MIATFSVKAITDLDDIANYLARNASVDTALAVIARIEATIHDTLLANPNIGMVLPIADMHIRALPAQQYRRYMIFYTIEANRVRIVRILHGHRDIARLLNENTD